MRTEEGLEALREFLRIMEDARTTSSMPNTVKQARTALLLADKVTKEQGRRST